MTTYEPGTVVLVKFLFSEGVGFKKRPAVVISSPTYNTKRSEIIIAAITSNIKRVLVGDTPIGGWKEAGLLFPSLVVAILQTIKQDMIERELGVLPPQDFERVRDHLRAALAL